MARTIYKKIPVLKCHQFNTKIGEARGEGREESFFIVLVPSYPSVHFSYLIEARRPASVRCLSVC